METVEDAADASGRVSRHDLIVDRDEHYRLLDRPEIVSGPVLLRAFRRVFGEGSLFLLVADPVSASMVAFRDAEALLTATRLETRHPFLLFRHVAPDAVSLFLWNTVGGLVAETHEETCEGGAALFDVMSAAVVRYGSPLSRSVDRTAVRTIRLHPRAEEAARHVSEIFADVHLAVLEADRIVPGPDPEGGFYLPERDDGLYHLCLAAWWRLGGRGPEGARIVPVVVGVGAMLLPREDFVRLAVDAAAFGAASFLGEPCSDVEFAAGRPVGRGPAYAAICGLLRGLHGAGVCDGLSTLYELPKEAAERLWWESTMPGVHLVGLQEEIDTVCEEEADCLRSPVRLVALAHAVPPATRRIVKEIMKPQAAGLPPNTLAAILGNHLVRH